MKYSLLCNNQATLIHISNNYDIFRNIRNIGQYWLIFMMIPPFCIDSSLIAIDQYEIMPTNIYRYSVSLIDIYEYLYFAILMNFHQYEQIAFDISSDCIISTYTYQSVSTFVNIDWYLQNWSTLYWSKVINNVKYQSKWINVNDYQYISKNIYQY